MADPKKSDGWLMVLYGVLLLAGLALLALGMIELVQSKNAMLLGFGVLAIAIPAALYPIAAALHGDGGSAGGDQATELLKSINDRLLISDAAKRIAYREQDRAALRQAIREDIERSDYDAALVLVDDMGQQYGYREEAEQFREEILATRQAETDAKIQEAISRLDSIIERHDWAGAQREAMKVQRLFPDTLPTRNLEQHVLEARERYKHELERQFLQAAERDDVDRAMELLKELDVYLTETEAEPFRETARGVIGKKRENFGVQFKLAVHDREWSTAVRVGEQIIREFPNTKMADEVRSLIDELRRRSAEQHAARAQTAGV
ncbi:MAG: hypothetical protein WD042_18665 [Phycisphaeraceae bacterium]